MSSAESGEIVPAARVLTLQRSRLGDDAGINGAAFAGRETPGPA